MTSSELALGSTKTQEDVVETASELLPGGHWMKITPKRPLDFGEYALMEVISEKEINLGVWDFGVHPVAPENRDVIKPQPRRPSHWNIAIRNSRPAQSRLAAQANRCSRIGGMFLQQYYLGCLAVDTVTLDRHS